MRSPITLLRLRPSFRTSFLALVACTGATLGAQTLLYQGFASQTGLSVNGDAAVVTTTDGAVLRLTPDSMAMVGSAFTTNRIGIEGFSTAFQFRLSNPGGIDDASEQIGGDGFTFTLQTVNSSTIGASGGGLGYSGINSGVAIEFDTYFNSGDDPSPASAGTNHVGINRAGSVASVATERVPTRLDNGNVWNAWIDYNGSTLEVRLSTNGLRPSSALLTHSINIASQLNGTTAFVGFTAGTGSAYADHDILNWAYSPSYVVGGISSVPEPGTYALLGLGSLLLLGARRFRRAR